MLSKVKVSGGGRCNVTHHCFDNRELVKNYPRGSKELLQVFSQFSVKETIDWFKDKGIILKTEDDGRMFPYSDSSQTIIDCFLELSKILNIKIKMLHEVFSIQKTEEIFLIKTNQAILNAHTIICASGGHNKSEAYHVIKNLGHTIDSPLPSLFTINLPTDAIKKELQGVSVKNAEVKIANSKLKYSGPVLITHWGLSGPAVLKLSAFAAKEFYEMNYISTIHINWVYPLNLNETLAELKSIREQKNKAFPLTYSHFDLPKRLWEFLCIKSGINNLKPWAETSNIQLNQLAENLCNSHYAMEGKTTFKEEFVTCGGIQLKEVDFKTMQSKLVPGLFFCGEILNIDGITGGFNFQSAWSTAWVCAQNV